MHQKTGLSKCGFVHMNVTLWPCIRPFVTFQTHLQRCICPFVHQGRVKLIFFWSFLTIFGHFWHFFLLFQACYRKNTVVKIHWQPISRTMHTGVTPTRKSNRDSCWQFDFQASTGVHWLRNHVKVMGEREILNKSYKFS